MFHSDLSPHIYLSSNSVSSEQMMMMMMMMMVMVMVVLMKVLHPHAVPEEGG